MTSERLAEIRAYRGWCVSDPHIESVKWHFTHAMRFVRELLDEVTLARIALKEIASAVGEPEYDIPAEVVKTVIGCMGALDEARKDTERINLLESVMYRKDSYVEVYLAGLRRGRANATAYQVEFQPLTQPVVSGSTLREAIDAAVGGDTNEQKREAK